MILTIGMVYEYLDQRIGRTAMRRRAYERGKAAGLAEARQRQEQERQRKEIYEQGRADGYARGYAKGLETGTAQKRKRKERVSQISERDDQNNYWKGW